MKAIPPSEQFTIADVASASGASTAMVRKAIADLVGEGKVEEAGTAEGHEGPGRAPTVYKRAREKA